MSLPDYAATYSKENALKALQAWLTRNLASDPSITAPSLTVAGGVLTGPLTLTPGALTVKTGADATKGIDIWQNSATQSANLLQFSNSAGTALAAVDSSGKYLFPNGTVTAPGISFINDTTSGLYVVGAGELGFSIGGVQQFDFQDSMFTVYSTSTSANRGVRMDQYSASSDGARGVWEKARGTKTSPGVITAGDNLGRLVFRGHDGTNFIDSAYILVTSTGTVASTRIASQLQFQTARDAAGSAMAARLTISEGSNAADAFTVTVAANGALVVAGGNSGTSGQVQLNTAGVTAAPNIAGVATTGTNAVPIKVQINSALGTGSGAGGALVLATPTTLGSGATPQTFVDRLTISQGAVTTDAFTVTVASGGQVVVPVGTAALPSIAVAGDTTTGLFQTSASQLSVSVTGTERYRFSANNFQMTGSTTFQPFGVNGTGANLVLAAGNGITGTDKAPGSVTIGGQIGTGTGAGGSVVLATPTTLTTGTTAQTSVTRLTISQGAVTTDAWTAAMAANGRLTFASGGAAATPAIAATAGAEFFIGTTDAQPVGIVNNGTEKVRVSTVGAAGLGMVALNNVGTLAAPSLTPFSVGGTDGVGKAFVLGAGVGTGAGAPPALTLATSTTLTTGTTAQTLVARLTISGGAVTTDASTMTLADKLDIIASATTGSRFGGTGSKIALYGATPLLQPARVAQLTDNSGGTSGGNTIAAIGAGGVDTTAALRTDTRNAIATLAAKINAIEAALSQAGGGIGAWA